jgi:hypothetical protein
MRQALEGPRAVHHHSEQRGGSYVAGPVFMRVSGCTEDSKSLACLQVGDLMQATE